MESEEVNNREKKENYSKIFCKRILYCGLASIILVLLIVNLCFIFKKPSSTTKNETKVCTNVECIAMADRIYSAMDESVHPCENFYDFACGRYMDGKIEKLQPVSDTM